MRAEVRLVGGDKGFVVGRQIWLFDEQGAPIMLVPRAQEFVSKTCEGCPLNSNGCFFPQATKAFTWGELSVSADLSQAKCNPKNENKMIPNTG